MVAVAVAPVEISCVGSAVDGSGTVWQISHQMLSEVAESYDPQVHVAPILINHDVDRGNFGLVESLSFDGRSLLAVPHKVDPEFAEWVNDGRWPRLSAGFYSPDCPANPFPGMWALKEFSVVQIPGVKGLAEPEFTEPADEGVLYFAAELSPDEMPEETPEETPETPEEDDELATVRAAVRAELRSLIEAELRAELDARRLDLEQRERALAERLAVREADEADIRFLEGEVQQGFPPFLIPQSRVVLQALRDAQPIVFGEGDAQTQISPRGAFMEVLEGVRLQGVSFAVGDGLAAEDLGSGSRSRSPLEVAARAREIRAGAAALGEKITVSEAVRRAGDEYVG